MAGSAALLQSRAGHLLSDTEAEDTFQHANKTTIYKLRKADLVLIVSMKVQSLRGTSLEELEKMNNDKLRILIQNEVPIPLCIIDSGYNY